VCVGHKPAMHLIFVSRGWSYPMGSKTLAKHVKTYIRFHLDRKNWLGRPKPSWGVPNCLSLFSCGSSIENLLKFIINSSELQTRRSIYVFYQLDERNIMMQSVLSFDKDEKSSLAGFGNRPGQFWLG
jgi:hypothetical protein